MIVTLFEELKLTCDENHLKCNFFFGGAPSSRSYSSEPGSSTASAAGLRRGGALHFIMCQYNYISIILLHAIIFTHFQDKHMTMILLYPNQLTRTDPSRLSHSIPSLSYSYREQPLPYRRWQITIHKYFITMILRSRSYFKDICILLHLL